MEVNEGDLVVDEPDEGDGLRAAAAAMTKLANELRADRPKVRDIDRRSRRQDVIMVLVAIMAVASGVIALGNRSIGAAIQDCIDPTGQCYRDSRSRTSDVQRAVIEQQHGDAVKTLSAVCSFIEQHSLTMPPECASVVPAGTPTTR